MSNQAWRNFKQTMKERLLTKGKKKERCVLNSGELVVQRLSSTVSGKAQKYSRVGPRVFVSFPYEEMTINNTTSACEKHFSSVTDGGVVCDVVAGDQGPSCRMSLLEAFARHTRLHPCTNNSQTRPEL